jgi:hypothetical protein
MRTSSNYTGSEDIRANDNDGKKKRRLCRLMKNGFNIFPLPLRKGD